MGKGPVGVRDVKRKKVKPVYIRDDSSVLER